MLFGDYKCICIAEIPYSSGCDIAVKLCEQSIDGRNFTLISGVTAEEELNSHKDKFLLSIKTDDGQFGIYEEEYKNALSEGIPVLLVPPCCLGRIKSDLSDMSAPICFFIDVNDNEYRDKSEEVNRKVEQLTKFRSYANEAHYILKNNNLETSCSLIKHIWQLKGRGGGLSGQLIREMIDCGVLLENAQGKVKGASYDLRLGDEFYYGGEIKKLSDEKPFLTIEPYDYAIVSCIETANIPLDVIGKFDLSVGLFCQGIILSNGPQIDPGFRGTLFCLLFNTSNRAVHLKRKQHYATIEFNKLIDFSTPYQGKYKDKNSIIDYIPANALFGAINELKKEMEKLRNDSRFMQNIYLAVVALMFAILSIMLVR